MPPFKSFAQMAYLKHNEPATYKKWVRKYGKHVEGNVRRVKALKKG